jgi:hypothetical protein
MGSPVTPMEIVMSKIRQFFTKHSAELWRVTAWVSASAETNVRQKRFGSSGVVLDPTDVDTKHFRDLVRI